MSSTEKITYKDEVFYRTHYNNVSVIRDCNGYYQASKICNDNGKRIIDWLRLKSTQSLLTVYSELLNMSCEIIEFTKELSRVRILTLDNSHEDVTEQPLIYQRFDYSNTLRGYYIHPKLVHHLAEWCNIRYAIKVSIIMDLINNELHLKNIALNDKINEMIKNDDELNHKYGELESSHEHLQLEHKAVKVDYGKVLTKLDVVTRERDDLVDERVQLLARISHLETLTVPEDDACRVLTIIKRPDKVDQYDTYRISGDSSPDVERAGRSVTKQFRNEGFIIAQFIYPSSMHLRKTFKDVTLDHYRFNVAHLDRVIKRIRSSPFHITIYDTLQQELDEAYKAYERSRKRE